MLFLQKALKILDNFPTKKDVVANFNFFINLFIGVLPPFF